MNIIIVGAGEIGAHLAQSLSRENHSIVVIEADESVSAELKNKADARFLVGNGASVATLIEAGARECDLFLSLTSDTNVNLVAASAAKGLGAAKTIARVHPGVQRENRFLDYGERFGIDYLFSPERLAAVELAKHVRSPHAVLVEEIARGSVELQQLRIRSDSRMLDTPLRDLGFPARVRVGAIARQGKTFIPGAEEKLEAHDLVTLVGEPAPLHEITRRFRNRPPKGPEVNIVIFGGGEYGFALAELLADWHCRVRIFESDRDRCEELSELLPGVTLLNADATSLSEMKEEQVGDAHFFIAVTPEDEDNVMTCLQAQNLGARHCLAIVHRADYADTLTGFREQLGILAAVSPREAARKDLSRFIISDRFHLLRKLEGVELIETVVDAGAAAEGKEVREVDWPEDCLLVALLHGTDGIVPAAEDRIEEGDSLYALVGPKAKRKFLRLASK